MRCAIPILLALCLLPSHSAAVIIDRIAVTVGTQVITESELELAVRLTAFMNQEPLDFGTENRRRSADRLITQKFVLKELDFTRFPRPAIEEVAPLLNDQLKQHFNGDQTAYRASLEKYGITEDQLKQHLLWQMTFFRFLDFRFRPGIPVNEADVEDYFKSRILPLAQKANPGKPVSIEDYRDRIERILSVRRQDGEFQTWLREMRTRTKVEYRDETLRPPPQAEAAPQ